MRIAFYCDNNKKEIILTPEDNNERLLLDQIKVGQQRMNIYKGGFYLCNGGWMREGTGERESIIFVIKEKPW